MQRPPKEVAQWVAGNLTLARQAAMAEKQCSGGLDASRSLADEAAALREEEQGNRLARLQYCKRVHKQLKGLKDLSLQVQKAVEKLAGPPERRDAASGVGAASGGGSGGGGGAGDAAELQRLMERLQGDLAVFKGRMKGDYEETAASEKALSRDLITLRDRFRVWQDNDDDADDAAAAEKEATKTAAAAAASHAAGARRCGPSGPASSSGQGGEGGEGGGGDDLRRQAAEVDAMVRTLGKGGWAARRCWQHGRHPNIDGGFPNCAVAVIVHIVGRAD